MSLRKCMGACMSLSHFKIFNSCSCITKCDQQNLLGVVSVKSEKHASWVTLRPQWDCCCQGEAEVRIIDFKTTWSEFQMPSQTAPAEAKPRCVYSILKLHGQNSRSPVRLLLSEAKPSYIYSIWKPHGQSSKSKVRLLLSEVRPIYLYLILKPHGQSSKSPVRLLPYEGKLSYVYTILIEHQLSRVHPKQLCELAHLGCTCAVVTS